MDQFCFGYRDFTLRGVECSLSGFERGFGREVLALRIVDFLLGDETVLFFGHAGQTLVLEVQDPVLGFIAADLVLRPSHFIGAGLDCRLIFLKLRFQLGNFEHGHDLALANARSVVDIQGPDVAGLLCIDFDLLERHEFGAYGEVVCKRADLGADDADRNACGRVSGARIAGLDGISASTAPAEEGENNGEKSEPPGGRDHNSILMKGVRRREYSGYLKLSGRETGFSGNSP